MNLIKVEPDTIINDNLIIKNQYILKLLEKIPQNETFINFEDHYRANSIDNEFYQSCFLHVVTETIFDYPHNSYSEKTWKPIAIMRPFVIVSVPGSLKTLHEFGFKTFNKWWDESYDNINDPMDRMLAISDLLESITKKSTQELTKMLHEMEPILVHNYKHYHSDFRQEWIDNIHQQCKQNLLPR